MKLYPIEFESWYTRLKRKTAELEKKADMNLCECDVGYCCDLCNDIQQQAVNYAHSKNKYYEEPNKRQYT